MNSFAQPAKWEKVFWPVLASAALLLAWYWLVAWTHTKVFPSPLDVGKGISELVQKDLLWRYAGDSLRRVAIGFGLATLLGVPTGFVLGWYPAVNQIVNPVIQILRPISPIAWIPVAIVFFGVGDTSAVFLIFLAAFFPIVVTCANAVSQVPLMFRQAGMNFGLTSAQLMTRVLFPAALPQMLLGLRIALGVAWLVVVAAEMIAVNSGLGYLVIDSRNAGKRYDLVVAAILSIGVIGLLLDSGLRQAEKIGSVRWGFRDGQ